MAHSVAHSEEVAPPPIKEKKVDKLEFTKRDIARSKQTCHGESEDWIAFTSSEAAWIPFTVDPRMVSVFAERDEILVSKSQSAAEDWLSRAENVLHEWIVRTLVTNETRPTQFRALGRGWLFLQLSAQHVNMSRSVKSSYGAYDRKYTRFKWWFEGVERVLLNRSDELPDMNIKTPEELSKWTSGYVHGAELVFVLRGVFPKAQVMSLKKWRSDYNKAHVWGTSEDLQRAISAPVLSDSERAVLAKNSDATAAKRRAKRERQKAKKAEAAAGDIERVVAEAAAKEQEEGLKASQAFDNLLEEMRLEEKCSAPTCGARRRGDLCTTQANTVDYD